MANGDAKHAFFGKLGSPTEVALKADCLCKTYDGHQEAVKDVTFSVKSGEVREIPILESFESLYRTEFFFEFLPNSALAYWAAMELENRQYSQCYLVKWLQHRVL